MAVKIVQTIYRLSVLLTTLAIFLTLFHHFSFKNEVKPLNYATTDNKTKNFIKNIGDDICGKTINLPSFPEENVDKNQQIFFIETYVEPRPRGRTICAYEAAIRIGKMPVKVFFRSSVLTINHPALCSLVKEFYPHKLSFYTAGIEELFAGTPLRGITARLQWRHPLFLLQLSDLMRAAILYKYGGFYLDQDVLTLRDLTGFRNAIVVDNVTS